MAYGISIVLSTL